MARYPRGSYMVRPLPSLEVTTPCIKSTDSTLSSICKKVRLAGGRMQRTLRATRRTPHVSLRAWCKHCLRGRVKADVLRPRIVGMRGPPLDAAVSCNVRPCPYPHLLRIGTLLPAGALACVWIYGLHRHPALWKSPDSFVPERWLNGAQQAREGLPKQCFCFYVLTLTHRQTSRPRSQARLQ